MQRPGPANAVTCATCDYATPATTCHGGMTCYTYGGNGDTACAKYCCTDADCGTGKCTTKDSDQHEPTSAPSRRTSASA